MENTVIVGQQVAGESAKVRKQLEQLVKKVNSSLFDLADLLWAVKKNNFYEGYSTFREYTKTIGLKESKSRYLPRVVEVMEEVGIERSLYEPLGMAKLREITSLDINAVWVNPEDQSETQVRAFIKGFIEKGKEMSLGEIKEHVRTLKGLTGTEAMGFVHLYMKQIAIDNVAKPALQLAKMKIGSVGKDDEGISKDASDGQAAEMIFADFLAGEGNENENVGAISDNTDSIPSLELESAVD